MKQESNIPDKQYFKIGEVCEITGVKQHVLRYWETEFHHIRPQRIGSRQRLYSRPDIDHILIIKKLLKEEGFSISGAKKYLTRNRQPGSQDVSCKESQGDEQNSLLADIKRELLLIKKTLED